MAKVGPSFLSVRYHLRTCEDQATGLRTARYRVARANGKAGSYFGNRDVGVFEQRPDDLSCLRGARRIRWRGERDWRLLQEGQILGQSLGNLEEVFPEYWKDKLVHVPVCRVGRVSSATP